MRRYKRMKTTLLLLGCVAALAWGPKSWADEKYYFALMALHHKNQPTDVFALFLKARDDGGGQVECQLARVLGPHRNGGARGWQVIADKSARLDDLADAARSGHASLT